MDCFFFAQGHDVHVAGEDEEDNRCRDNQQAKPHVIPVDVPEAAHGEEHNLLEVVSGYVGDEGKHCRQQEGDGNSSQEQGFHCHAAVSFRCEVDDDNREDCACEGKDRHEHAA